jgi:ABC-type cobalamin/Fe3+-siderophores transport system ATPase subunit/predicted metal-dependent phosphoesterase TrpH
MSTETKNYDIFQNGSVWLKADFHLHTNADKQFKYSGEPNSYLKEYIAKLKEQSINIGVITNHNKFDKEEFKHLQKKACREEIFLLPSVELSVNDGANGIHTLIVFSDEWIANGNDYINPFLTSMFPDKPLNEYQNEDGRSDKNILQVVEELEKINRDYFFVFAHVEQRSGLWEEMKGGKLGDFSEKRYSKARNKTLGFQKVRTRDKRDEIKRLLKNWYPAEVEGSDCKSIDEIGAKDGETWLKIGDFTFEAVKYALSDYSNRVKISQPERYKHSYIKNISFEGGTLDGKQVNFSPELNTLIGIRGSGKSSILETIRYVLDIPFGEQATDKKYKSALIAHTLGSGGKTIITAKDQYGSEFQVKRIFNELPEVFFDNQLQPGVSIRETIIRKPIYFGQKDLSSSGEGFEKDLVEKLIGESLYSIRNEIADKKQVVSNIISSLQKLNHIDDLIEETTQQKQDAEFKLKRFSEYGVEEKFNSQTNFDADEQKINQILKDVASYRDDLDNFLNLHEEIVNSHSAYASNQNQEFFQNFMDEYAKIVKILEQQNSDKKTVDEIIISLQEKFTKFQTLKKSFTEEFAGTRRKIEVELKKKGIVSINLEEYPTLKRKITSTTQKLDALKKQKAQTTSIKTELLQTLSELNTLWLNEFQTIKKQLDKINDKHSALTIETGFKEDSKGFLGFMKSTFKGSNIRETAYQNLVDKYHDFIEIYKDFENAKKIVGSLKEIFEKYFFENLKDLLTFKVENKFTIKYRGKELQHHSLGQRASALILFVLNQHENDVIIVDQPEDDLDNQTIYEDVIKLIGKLKPSTQFIFATHNANYPVLGDAELIHSCRYSDDEIVIQSGSIDSQSLQQEIVDIMEDGETAFNKRKEIYEIWKL